MVSSCIVERHNQVDISTCPDIVQGPKYQHIVSAQHTNSSSTPIIHLHRESNAEDSLRTFNHLSLTLRREMTTTKTGTHLVERARWPCSVARSTGTGSQTLLCALLAADTLDEISNAENGAAVQGYVSAQGKADKAGRTTVGLGLRGPYHVTDEGTVGTRAARHARHC